MNNWGSPDWASGFWATLGLAGTILLGYSFDRLRSWILRRRARRLPPELLAQDMLQTRLPWERRRRHSKDQPGSHHERD